MLGYTRKLLIISLSITPYVSSLAQNKTPNYNDLKFWAAHPAIEDATDLVDSTSNHPIDVFFVYPTLYTERRFKSYSADLEDKRLNKKIQSTTLRNQASVFSGLANIYAPYYRQMHINGYYTIVDVKKENALRAFDTAYDDVLRAFKYYMKNLNDGKPYVLAGHSQGTNHMERLLKEYILPSDSLNEGLVLAYLIGMPIKDDFSGFRPCKEPDETHCFVTWRSYGMQFQPKQRGDSIVCTNPITFSADERLNKLEDHQGILFKRGEIKRQNSILAKAEDGYLSIEIVAKPQKWIYRWDNYHVADYNLFWKNIRNNFELRIAEVQKY